MEFNEDQKVILKHKEDELIKRIEFEHQQKLKEFMDKTNAVRMILISSYKLKVGKIRTEFFVFCL